MSFHSQPSRGSLWVTRFKTQTHNDHLDVHYSRKNSSDLATKYISKVNSWFLPNLVLPPQFYICYHYSPSSSDVKTCLLVTSHSIGLQNSNFVSETLFAFIHPFHSCGLPWSPSLPHIFSGPQLASPPLSFPAPIHTDCWQVKLLKAQLHIHILSCPYTINGFLQNKCQCPPPTHHSNPFPTSPAHMLQASGRKHFLLSRRQDLPSLTTLLLQKCHSRCPDDYLPFQGIGKCYFFHEAILNPLAGSHLSPSELQGHFIQHHLALEFLVSMCSNSYRGNLLKEHLYIKVIKPTC